MMGFGFLFMLLVWVVPAILVVVLGVWLFTKVSQKNSTTIFTPGRSPVSQSSGRNCSHCGSQLQHDWSHCPQCGAPIE